MSTEMPSEFSVGEDVKELVQEIISKNNLNNISDIIYQVGSQAGDGYASKTVAVDIINGNDSFRLFLKCALNIKTTEALPMHRLYENEIYFYDVIVPAYTTFLEKRDFQNSFRHVPKCYGTSAKYNILALEHLRDLGFTLHDRTTPMDNSDIEFVLRTFAKFHAVSFAFKDQENEKYLKLVEGVGEDLFSKFLQVDSVTKMITDGITSFVNKLDPVNDKHILDKCDELDKKAVSSVRSPKNFLNQYSILTQGDCWCNNMMFLYDNEDHKKPVDIRLIDWQGIRQASPVFDIAYFFYTIASEEALSNLDNHLRSYHTQLAKSIKELGSDPDILYPFLVFENEWKQHALYGFGMASMLIKYMLSSKDEVVSLDGLDLSNMEEVERIQPKLKNESEFLRRMMILVRHFIEHGFL